MDVNSKKIVLKARECRCGRWSIEFFRIAPPMLQPNRCNVRSYNAGGYRIFKLILLFGKASHARYPISFGAAWPNCKSSQLKARDTRSNFTFLQPSEAL